MNMKVTFLRSGCLFLILNRGVILDLSQGLFKFQFYYLQSEGNNPTFLKSFVNQKVFSIQMLANIIPLIPGPNASVNVI